MNKSIIGFFRSKCIINEISSLIKKKGVKIKNFSDFRNFTNNIEQDDLLLIEIFSNKEMLKLEKTLSKLSNYIIIILREDNIKINFFGNLYFIKTPLKTSDFIEQVEKILKSLEKKKEKKKVGNFFLTSSELIQNNKSNDKIKLTSLESKFLNYLFEKKDGYTKQELLSYVWGYNAKVETHTLESLVYRLRRKIESDPNSPKILVQFENKYILRS